MTETRYNQGLKLLKEVVGQGAEDTLGKLKRIAPDVGVLLAEYFGDIYSRKALNLKTREMVTFTVLAATGKIPQLKVHLRATLNVGWTIEEINEVIITMIPYVGFPTVLNALEVVQEFIEEKQVHL
ncbi:MAG TPA: carboxymuconolactone decarboxylase family protein [Neobacillus sp.]